MLGSNLVLKITKCVIHVLIQKLCCVVLGCVVIARVSAAGISDLP